MSGKQRKGFFITIGDGADGTCGAVDGRGVTPQRLTMLFEYCQFMSDRFQIAQHITGITVLRNQFQGNLLSTPTDQDGDMWLLYALRLVNGTTYLIILALEISLFLLPHGMNDLERFPQHTQALWSI